MLLLLPLFILVLVVALQRWRSATVCKTSAHMDVLTYHIVLLEILGVAVACVYCYTSLRKEQSQMNITVRFLCFIGIGQSLFHLLACLDRYLAVVHPIRYMWMRQSAGIRLRNATIGCSWILCLLSCAIHVDIIHFFYFSLLFSSAFFSSETLCILFVISHLGPMGKSRAKQRALRTVAAISTSLVLRFLPSVGASFLYEALHLNTSQQCLMTALSLLFCLPSSLVMPLLFLQRVGKLSNCQRTSRNKE